MHRLARSIVALAASLVLVPLLAGVVLAGGWAEVVAVDAGEPPAAGEPFEYRFRLLQHGVTPVDWGTVHLTATPAGGGEAIAVEATRVGDGEWMAVVTVPSNGEWQLAVRHVDLETSPVPSLTVGGTPATVAAAGQAALPAWLPLVLAFSAAGVMALATVTGLAMARAQRRSAPSVEVSATG